MDANGNPIRFNPAEWHIPNWDTKLYGGQQFERLLAEFKAVTEHVAVAELTMDELATSAGLSGLKPIPNQLWAVRITSRNISLSFSMHLPHKCIAGQRPRSAATWPELSTSPEATSAPNQLHHEAAIHYCRECHGSQKKETTNCR